MTPADTDRVSELQSRLLTTSAVTQLGPAFLHHFYRASLAQRVCEAVVACDAHGVIVGAAVAATNVEAFNAAVSPRIAGHLAVALMTRWRLALRFCGSLFERRASSHAQAELLLLFVDDAYQGSGTGTLLLQSIEQRFTQEGITKYQVTVRSEMTDALAFYAARGFAHTEDCLVLGRPMTYLTKVLSSERTA